MAKLQEYYQDKLVLITGAASGLGFGLSQAMAALGAEVVLTDYHSDLLAKAVKDLETKGYKVHGMPLDVVDGKQFAAVALEVVQRFGRIDILINNAGMGIIGLVLDHELQDWQRIIDVNVKGVVHGVNAVYPLMAENRKGSIINIASLAGLVAVPGGASYALSKHAVIGLSTSLRAEAANLGVNVTAICPSFVETNIMEASKLLNLPSSIRSRIVKAAGGAISLDDFVDEAIAGIPKEKSLLVLPRRARMIWRLGRLMPFLLEANARKVAEKLFAARLVPSAVKAEAVKNPRAVNES